jgi:cytochrome b561
MHVIVAASRTTIPELAMPTRYHPVLVALHWLLAVMIVLALVFGTFALAPVPNDDPAKLAGLRGHMTIGIAILALMLIRLVARLRSDTPPEADIGSPSLNRLSRAAHWALYIGVFAMVGSGIALSAMSGLPGIVFGGSGEWLPESFHDYAPRAVHGFVAPLLMLLIAGHVGAALYHQFVRRDGLFRRMWFGRRS